MRISPARLFTLAATLVAAVSQAHAANQVGCMPDVWDGRVRCTLDLGVVTATGLALLPSHQSALNWTSFDHGLIHPAFVTIDSMDEGGATLSFDPGFEFFGGGSGSSEVFYGGLEISNLMFEAQPGYRINEVTVTVEGEARVYGAAQLEIANRGSVVSLVGQNGKETSLPFSLSAPVPGLSKPSPDRYSFDLFHMPWGWSGDAAYLPGPDGTASVYGTAYITFSKVSYQVSVSPVPEPGTLALAAVGGVLVLGWAQGRRRRSR